MITFNNIVERFEIFAENHFFIKSFSFGSPDDVDLSKFEEFPLMHLVYTGATYDAGTKTYNLEVYILDVPHDKKGKVIPQKEAISDSEQCAEDILADIRMGGNIFLFAQDYEVVNATTTPLEEETKNVLSGVLLDLSVAIPYEWDACNAPIDGVAPGGGEVVYARRGVLRMLTLDGSTDVQSVRTIKVTNGTLTDDGDGVVTLDTGGVETLEALTDVTITNAANGQVIKYQNGIWINAADGGAISLNDLTDVIISQPSTGEFFRYDGDEWVNDTANKSDVGLGNVDNTSDANKPISTATQTALDLKADITSVPTELDDLNDVQIIGTPTLGQALVYGAGKWLPGAAGATDLGDLDDVNTTGAAFGSLLTYNGASWDISGSQLPTDDIYFHQRYETESEALRTGATATTELYFTCTAQGNGLAESASSDTPTAGKIIRRKIYYSDAGFADPDTGTWVEFTPAPADDASFATVKAALLEYLKARTGGTVPISLKQTWEEVAAAPTFTGLLNETYGSGAAAAYGTRRLNGNYSGACMTIRRASDGTTQTIGFVGEEIDESAITNFCTGSTCTVQVWHDQSQTGGTGSGNDAEQTTPANQPTIYTGGQLVKDGGRLALDFDGSNDMLSFSNFSITSATNKAVFIVGANDETGSIRRRPFSIKSATGTLVAVWHDDNNTSAFSGNGFSNGVTITASNASQYLLTGQDYAGNQSIFLDGTAGATNTSGGTNTGAVAGYIGGYDATLAAPNNQAYFGRLQEIITYSIDQSSNRTDIEGNISAYYQSAKLLDESYGSGAEAAYSVRQLKRANTECMVIRRASDSTTTTIGFDGSGNISEADIISFCTGTTCTVSEWIDQSGNGNDATAAAPANEPTIYTGGAIVKKNGKAMLQSNSLTTGLVTTATGVNNSTFFGLLETNPTVSKVGVVFNGGSPSSDYLLLIEDGSTSGAFNVRSGSPTTYVNGVTASFTRDSIFDFAANGSLNSVVNFDGSSYTYEFGWSTNTGIGMPSMQEAIIYPSDKSGTDQTSIEENIGDYFTQNTPLLDTYSGAAAAYSLRLLDSSYVGSAIRVRRSSDNAEQDIGFNVFSELDTVSLLAFAGTGDAFVKTWYDQSGNSNDATQTATGSQPKIVSSGVVIVENGKPAIDFDGSSNYIPLVSGALPSNINNASGFAVYTRDATSGSSHTVYSLGVPNTRWYGSYLYNSDNKEYFAYGTSFTVNEIQQADTNQHIITNIAGSTQGDARAFLDGTLAVTASLQSATPTAGAIGSSNDTGSNPMDGTIQELIIYHSDESANRTNIETNIATFYDITI